MSLIETYRGFVIQLALTDSDVLHSSPGRTIDNRDATEEKA